MSQVNKPIPKAGTADSGVQVVNNSALLSAFNVIGCATTLVVDVAMAQRYGLGSETDAFFIALTVPQFVATVLLVSVSVGLVPFSLMC